MLRFNSFKGSGKVTEINGSQACVKIEFPYSQPTEYYWVTKKDLEVGDDATVSLIHTSSGQWYEGYKKILPC